MGSAASRRGPRVLLGGMIVEWEEVLEAGDAACGGGVIYRDGYVDVVECMLSRVPFITALSFGKWSEIIFTDEEHVIVGIAQADIFNLASYYFIMNYFFYY